MKKLSIFIFYFVFASCNKDIFIPDNNHLKLVLYPYLDVNQSIRIYAYSSSSVNDTGKISLNNAFSLIYEEGKCVDTVQLNKKGIGISKISSKERQHYKIKVVADNYPVAETEVVMPSRLTDITVDTFSYSEAGKYPYTYFIISFTDNAADKDYYRIDMVEKVYNKYPDSRFYFRPFQFYCEAAFTDFYSYSGGELYLTNEPKELLENITLKENIDGQWYVHGGPVYTSDIFFNGEKVFLKIFSRQFKLYFDSNNPRQFRIEVAKISADFYQGLLSQAKYNSMKKQDLPIAEETPIFSSVKDGYGFAAASATITDSSLSNRMYIDFFNQ